MTVRVTSDDFDLSAEVAAMTADRVDIGAVVTFTGLVRDMAGPARLASMTLEHYPGMTEAELNRIEREATERWPLQGVRIVHRVGRLAPGDRIVLVAVASPHRAAAFEAAAFLMDYLKTRAPFWKKETDTAGTGTWVDARVQDTEAETRWRR